MNKNDTKINKYHLFQLYENGGLDKPDKRQGTVGKTLPMFHYRKKA